MAYIELVGRVLADDRDDAEETAQTETNND
jgi:hypothetical protein